MLVPYVGETWAPIIGFGLLVMLCVGFWFALDRMTGARSDDAQRLYRRAAEALVATHPGQDRSFWIGGAEYPDPRRPGRTLRVEITVSQMDVPLEALPEPSYAWRGPNEAWTDETG